MAESGPSILCISQVIFERVVILSSDPGSNIDSHR